MHGKYLKLYLYRLVLYSTSTIFIIEFPEETNTIIIERG